MRELRYFFVPNLNSGELPPDEAVHCLKVLRLAEGSPIFLTDGKGKICQARISDASHKRCRFQITDAALRNKDWRGRIHVAMAPTKSISRTEWFVEKAIEIGVDEISFLVCTNSERRGKINMDRMEKIAIAAMKQSHKAFLPRLNGPASLSSLLQSAAEPQKFIAHCFDEADIDGANPSLNEIKSDLIRKRPAFVQTMSEENQTMSEENQTMSEENQTMSEETRIKSEKNKMPSEKTAGKPYLLDADTGEGGALVLIGPEGDFTIGEVREAISHGFRAVSLGNSRLRTETAALVAAHLIHIKHSA